MKRRQEVVTGPMPTAEALAGQVAHLQRELTAVAHELVIADPADVAQGTALQARRLALVAALEAAQDRHAVALEAERQAEQERRREELATQRAAALAVVDQHAVKVRAAVEALQAALAAFDGAVAEAAERGAYADSEVMAPLSDLRRGVSHALAVWEYQAGLAGQAEVRQATLVDEARTSVEKAKELLEFARQQPDRLEGRGRDRLIEQRVYGLVAAERLLAMRLGREYDPGDIAAKVRQAQAGGVLELPSLAELDASLQKARRRIGAALS